MCHSLFFMAVGAALLLASQYVVSYLSRGPDEAERGYFTFEELRKILRHVGQHGYNPKQVETLFNLPAEKYGTTCLRCDKIARWFKSGFRGCSGGNNLDECDYEYAPLREAPSPYEMLAKFARHHVPKDLAHQFAAIFKSERLHESYVEDIYAHAAALEREEAEAAAEAKLERKEKEERIAAELREEEEIAREAKLSEVPEVEIPEVQGMPVYIETSYFPPIPVRKAPLPPPTKHISITLPEGEQTMEQNKDRVPFPVLMQDSPGQRQRRGSGDSDVTIVPFVRIIKPALPKWLLSRRRKAHSL